MKSFHLIVPILVMSAVTAQAQDALESSSIEQQRGAIQAEITQGISDGTLSPQQIQQLQQQEQTLSNPNTAQTGNSSLDNPDALRPNKASNSPIFNHTGPAANGPSAGSNGFPNSFTYNSLGPDAYQAQKYQNPGYVVPGGQANYSQIETGNLPSPATTPSEATGYSANGQPSNVFGNGYSYPAQNGGNANNGVYVYQPTWNREDR